MTRTEPAILGCAGSIGMVSAGGVTAFAVEFGEGQFARLKPMTARAEQDLIAE